jgi:nitroimidazol reductase NimA-like FMN-containing flavoprotein (pyridoxamine 5'-phosphate oxidase superfamily)
VSTRPTRELHKYSEATREKLDALLDQSVIGHFAFVEDGLPRVMPIAIVRDGRDILLHGSTGSPWMRLLATGVPVALSVAELDALVVARSAFESSMRFRSAVLFGSCAAVADDEKAATLDLVTDGLLPGRVSEVRRSSAKELAATLVLRMRIDDWSLKISDGWPDDSAVDIAGDAWAGVLPVRRGFEDAVPAPDLRAGIRVAASVAALSAG